MKKLIALLLALVMVIGLVACGAKEDAPVADAPVADQPAADNDAGQEDVNPYAGKTVTVAFESSEVNDAYQAQMDAFAAKYGCNVEVEILSGDATEANNTLYLRAATGNLPDIFKMSIGALANNLDPENNLVDLANVSFKGNMTEAYINAATDDNGHLWAVPTTTSNVAGVFYNKTVFNDLGLEIPTTWAEFLDTCKWIRENTDMDPVSNPYDGAAGKQITYLAQYYYIQEENPDFASQYMNQELDLGDSPALMNGLQKLYDLYQYGYQNADPLSTSLEDSARAICEGTAAFVICRTNIMPSVQTVAPEKYNDIGFFPVPDETADVRGVATWMPQGWYLSQTCEEQELAMLLLEYLTTPEAVEVYCTKVIPTGAFMLHNVTLPDTVSTAVIEAQEWVSKASTPVMEYFVSIKGGNLPDLLAMVGTGELTPEEAIEQIEADFRLNAEQNGIW